MKSRSQPDAISDDPPCSALRQLREDRGWSQSQLIRAMELKAASLGVAIAARSSLKTSVSRWENGVAPSRVNQRLLAAVFGVSATDLGFEQARRTDVTGERLVPSRTVSPEVVDVFAAVFGQFLVADSLLGPGVVLRSVVEQCRTIEGLSREAPAPVRADLLRLLARHCEFVGWLHQDCGDLVRAAEWTARAGDVAQVVGDSGLLAYMLMRRAGIATEAGKATDGLGLAGAALRTPTTTRLRALTLRQLAHGYAGQGDAGRCRRSIDQALDAVDDLSGEMDPNTTYCSRPYVLMEAGASLQQLGRLDEAALALGEAAASWPEGQARDRGLCLARLTDVRAAAGDVSGAATVGIEAAAVVAASPSARSQRTLRLVRNRLHPRRRVPEVAQLLGTLADVV